MYLSSKNNFFHGIMFHHFHDEKVYKKSQGSINQDDFYKLIKFVGRENILDADEFFKRYKEYRLKANNLCLTFDDCIRCHYDIALPVLEDLKIKSFFFVYSSVFENKPDLLEVYRYFRTNYFENIDQFYNLFFEKLGLKLSNFFNQNKKLIENKKNKFPYYSINDIKFRLVRDLFLQKKNYDEIMSNIFKDKNFKPEDYYKKLFMNKEQVIKLKELGHTIGLHSHNHITLIEKLSHNDQKNEYVKNINILSEILKCKKDDIKYMSHPCGSYNQDTLKILKSLGIELGFKQMMTIEPEKNMKKINNSSLEIAREDHANIIRAMNL